MNWQELKKMLLVSPTYLGLAPEFRQQIEDRLPNCDARQLQELQSILEEDKQNVLRYVEESKVFKKDMGKKILGMEEMLDHQKEMTDLDASMGTL